jgi:Zn-dependent peptidase ImmA (M78 family)
MPPTLKKLQFDENNVPFLRPEEIDERAEYMLSIFCGTCLTEPQATDLSTIIRALMDQHKVKFVFTQDLGRTSGGHKIRGRISLKDRIVWIDQSLQPSDDLHRLRFTIAHEIGHLALHRHKPIKNYDAIEDTDEELRMEFNHASGSRQIVEWQANRYASATLMPRYTVAPALRAFHGENNVHLNIGRVFVDDSPANRALYAGALNHLSLIYHVSRTVVRIRLQELGLLIDRRTRHMEGLANEVEHIWRNLH